LVETTASRCPTNTRNRHRRLRAPRSSTRRHALRHLRDAAHRHRVGGIRAGAFGRFDQSLRQRRERRLIEQVGSGSAKAAMRRMVKSSRTKSLAIEGLESSNRQTLQMCLITGISSIFATKCQTFSALPQGLVNHACQGLVNHAADAWPVTPD
jgi:hypothetical protein